MSLSEIEKHTIQNNLCTECYNLRKERIARKLNMEILLNKNYGVIHAKGFHSTVVNAGFFAGSRFDKHGLGGTAHLTEHMFVNLLEKSSTPSDNNAFNVISEINGQTNREILQGWIRTSYDFTLEAIDRMLRSIYQKELDENIFENEKKSIIGASLLSDNNKDPYEMIFDKTFELVFGSHPLSNIETGTHAESQNISVKDCRQHFLEHYCKGKKYLIFACDLDRMDVLSHLKKWENVFPDKTGDDETVSSEQLIPISSEPKTLNMNMDIGTIEVSRAVALPKILNLAPWKMDFISYILGKSPNSILFKILREKYGLAYDAHTRSYHFSDYYLFILYFGLTDAKNLDRSIDIIDDILSNISSYLNEEKLELYKKAFKEQYLMNSDNLFTLSKSLLFYALTDQPLHPDILFRNISQLTLKDIESILSTYLNPRVFSKVIIR